MGQEAELENLIRAKGFPDAVVCLGEKGMTVVVQKANLTFEETANLTDIITRSTGFSEQNIILIPKV
jgi:stage III sporulation protein AH